VVFLRIGDLIFSNEPTILTEFSARCQPHKFAIATGFVEHDSLLIDNGFN